MSNILKELKERSLPSDFQKEISKSALHVIFQSDNNSLINLNTIIEFDDILELSEDEKLKKAEKIFSNVESTPVPENNNKEEIYL